MFAVLRSDEEPNLGWRALAPSPSRQKSPNGKPASADNAAETADRVGALLRKAYRDALDEPVPPEMVDLIRRIAEGGSGEREE